MTIFNRIANSFGMYFESYGEGRFEKVNNDLVRYFQLNMDVIGRLLLNNICIRKVKKMLKRLLNKLFYVFSYEYDKDQIEKYLSQSTDLYDLENRLRELDRKKAYNRFYI